MKVAIIIFPNPTKGETMPPNRNPDAPKIAEADPIYALPDSIARVETEVNIIPSKTDIKNVSDS